MDSLFIIQLILLLFDIDISIESNLDQNDDLTQIN
mgnify:CR=1 FL=1